MPKSNHYAVLRPLFAFILAAAVHADPGGDVTCRWRGRLAVAPGDRDQCLEPMAGVGPSRTLPSNATTVARDGITICRSVWNPTPKPVDAVFLMDNSGSMEKGENSGGFNTPPGDPFGIRDRGIRLAIRQLRNSGGQVTAGFLSFFGLGGNQDYTVEPEIETEKLQRPLDIGRGNPEGAANLERLIRKVWKHNPNEALLPKRASAGEASKIALTYWSESLGRAGSWFKPESGYVQSDRHGIVLVSDGAIGDWKEVQDMAKGLPPVHGIHFGEMKTAAHLVELCSLTLGTFHLVPPTDTMAIMDAFRKVAHILSGSSLPDSILVRQVRFSPMAADSLKARPAGLDSNGNLILDLGRDLAIGKGLTATYVYLPGQGEMTYHTDAAGPALAASNENFTCGETVGLARPENGRIGGDKAGVGDNAREGKAHDALGREGQSRRSTPQTWSKPPFSRTFPATLTW